MENKEPGVISSLHNPRVKGVLRLRNSRERRRAGLFLIDGLREIEVAVEHSVDVLDVYYEEGFSLPLALRRRGAQWVPVSPQVMERMSYGEQSGGPVAVARTPVHTLKDLNPVDGGLFLVLDRIEKPGNLGACLRTAAAAGISGVLLNAPICELYNPNTIRASRGAVFQLPLAVTETDELRRFAEQHRIRMWTARVDGERALWECDFTSGTAIIFGNEADGLGADWSGQLLSSFRIPMQSSAVDSLNVSISAAVTLYEAVRQRSK
jgi:RNA methyltransferase, TrmH family